MEFLIFWAICGLITFAIHLTMSWYSGQDITIVGIISGIVGYQIAGPLGLAVTAGIMLQNMDAKVMIKGRKK